MSLTGNNILGGASGQTTGYDIDQSVRLDNAGADNPGNYLARMEDVWTTDGNQETWTISWWMKWDNEDSNSERWIYHVRGDIATSDVMGVDAILLDNEQLHYYCYTGGFSTLRCSIKTNRVFRDPSAWYHCMIVMDSTLAAAANRTKFYVNGVRETSFATDTQIPQDQATNTNMNANTYVGASMGATSTQSFGGYLAEFHRVDGQALGPASFGETNADTNQWVPVEYSGSYGTNGYYLKFQDSSALGDDSSGNTNDFTATNLVATDQVTDTPTNNGATWNPLANLLSTTRYPAYTEGNRVTYQAAGSSNTARASMTMSIPNGEKKHIEFDKTTVSSGYPFLQLFEIPNDVAGSSLMQDDGSVGLAGGATNPTYSSGDRITYEIDNINGRIYVWQNGSALNSANPSAGTGYTYDYTVPSNDVIISTVGNTTSRIMLNAMEGDFVLHSHLAGTKRLKQFLIYARPCYCFTGR